MIRVGGPGYRSNHNRTNMRTQQLRVGGVYPTNHFLGGEQMSKVCGDGAMCERTCPVMLLGRICPDPLTLIEEFLECQAPVS